MRIIFDVGANDGVFSVEDAKKGDTVWAFEPHPGFCDIIKSKIVELPNYNLVEKAVSDFNGRAAFNIFRSEDCSSLSTPGRSNKNPKIINAEASRPIRSVCEKSSFVFFTELAGVLTDHATSTA